MARILASTLFALWMAVPAFAQETTAPPVNEVATTAPDGTTGDQLAVTPQPPLVIPQLPPTTPILDGNPFRLSAGDFKNFFSRDTGHMLAYTALVAVATAPWDREGINNGFNLPTTVFESGNVIGNVAFQIGAGFVTYASGKATGNKKLAYVGRDVVRAQLLSQAMVQTLKYSIRRDRPDHSNDKSFPSGHSASMFATATVLQRYYGWKVGAPAYALGGYVALARMAWNRHHASDVVMGAGFGIASARTVTMSLAKQQFSVGVQPQVGGASVNFSKVYKK
jgi:membrane-associated phospholipid phosphatase